MKKKLAMLLLLVFGATMVLAGCGGNNNGQNQQAAQGNNQQGEQQTEGDGSWQRVQDAGVIRVGLDDSYEPMGFHDPETDELTGFDIEMAKMIGEKLGIEFEFVPYDWNGIVPGLQSGHFDVIISGMNMWPERKEQVDFVPYGIASQVIVVRSDYEDADSIKTIEDLKGKTIGSQTGSTGAKAAMSYDFKDGEDLLCYAQFPAAILDLQSGRLDAVIIDNFGAATVIANGEYKIVGEPVIEKGADADTAKIGIAVRKEDKELQEKLQGAVDELLSDGSLKGLSEKWIGLDITEGVQE